jgi:hypothetical protein
MTWIKKRVWQLGIAALLVLIGTFLIYTAGTGDVDTTLLWAGLILVWVALAIPLASKGFGAERENGDEKEEDEGQEGG